MLQIAPEKACFVALKASAFDAKVEVVEPDPGSNPSDEDMREVLEDYPDDATEDELKAFIDTLNEDEQIDLVALAWLGRGDSELGDWADIRAEAARAHNDHTAGYLMGMPLLGTYLLEALSQMGHSCEDLMP